MSENTVDHPNFCGNAPAPGPDHILAAGPESQPSWNPEATGPGKWPESARRSWKPHCTGRTRPQSVHLSAATETPSSRSQQRRGSIPSVAMSRPELGHLPARPHRLQRNPAHLLHYDRTDHPMNSTRAAIQQHWSASESGNSDTEHAIYAAEAILDYPQSGERFSGRPAIAAQRGGHPADRHFTVVRITGGGELWVSECIITYDGKPTYSISIMEFARGSVVHETQYFADPFGAPSWRTSLAEPMPGRHIQTA